MNIEDKAVSDKTESSEGSVEGIEKEKKVGSIWKYKLLKKKPLVRLSKGSNKPRKSINNSMNIEESNVFFGSS